MITLAEMKLLVGKDEVWEVGTHPILVRKPGKQKFMTIPLNIMKCTMMSDFEYNISYLPANYIVYTRKSSRQIRYNLAMAENRRWIFTPR